jgi:hypothetical protein
MIVYVFLVSEQAPGVAGDLNQLGSRGRQKEIEAKEGFM